MNREKFKQKYSTKTYLGDGLYASFDGYHFILSAERENGIHWVGLEPPVFDALIRYRKEVYKDAEKLNAANKLKNCATCNVKPMLKEYLEEDNIQAFYIQCLGCNNEGPFKHVGEHGYQKSMELCIEEWNNMQNS